MTTIVKPTVGATGWNTAVDATIDAVNSMLPAVAGYASSATTVTNSATVVDALGLSVTLAANSQYVIDGVLRITQAGGTTSGGHKGEFIVPASATGSWCVHSASAPNAMTTEVQILAASTGSASFIMKVFGFVTTTTAGTFKYQFAQQTATASRSTTIDIGSYLTLTKIG